MTLRGAPLMLHVLVQTLHRFGFGRVAGSAIRHGGDRGDGVTVQHATVVQGRKQLADEEMDTFVAINKSQMAGFATASLTHLALQPEKLQRGPRGFGDPPLISGYKRISPMAMRGGACQANICGQSSRPRILLSG